MSVERNTRVRSSQIKSILPNDLEATNERTDNYIPSYDLATEKFQWVPNAAGASNIEDLGDVNFDSGTPIDGHSLVYDNATSKWKSDFPTSLQDLDNDTKIQVEESADEDIIRFDVAGTQEVQMDANGLKLKTGADINEFSIDGLLAGNSDDVIPTEKAVKTYSDVIDDKTIKNQDNIALVAFKTAIAGSFSQFNMIDGIVDYYVDESGIDTVNSLNENYNSTDDYYSPSRISTPYAHYKCNDNASNTTVTDDGTGANNGIGNVNTSNYSVTGKINQAFEFNGTTEYINLDALSTDIASDNIGSISFWMKPTIGGQSDSQNGTIFSISDTDSGTTLWVHYTDGVGQDRVKIKLDKQDSADPWFIATPSGDVPDDDSWIHIVITHNGIEPKLYVNGSSVTVIYLADNDRTLWFNDLTGLDNGRFGCLNYNNAGNSDFYDGDIDDFRYYSGVVLTSDEIALLYNSNSGTEKSQPLLNMTLISDIFTAEAEPDTARIVLLEEDVSAISLNTDLEVWATKDGSNWAQGTLSDEGDYDASKRILVADFTLTGSGTSLEYKLLTKNNKDCKIHASNRKTT